MHSSTSISEISHQTVHILGEKKAYQLNSIYK